jgi:uncharacterized SAM-binding protein YcdF (DUF218 family)
MFFVSKVVWAVVQPSSFVGLLFLAGILLTSRGRLRTGSRCLAAGGVFYLLFGFSPLANWLLVPLELRAADGAGQDVASAAGIIVLGGAITDGSALKGREPRLNEAAERMTEAVRLADRYPELPIIFSGGKAELIESDNETESELARRFFQEFKILPPRLKLEDRSRNTLENATFTAKLLQPRQDQTFILVTSAYHMPRAKALFEAAGFRIIPWPVDFKTTGPADHWRLFSQASKGLRLTDIAAREWVGLCISWLRGDITWPRRPLAAR